MRMMKHTRRRPVRRNLAGIAFAALSTAAFGLPTAQAAPSSALLANAYHATTSATSASETLSESVTVSGKTLKITGSGLIRMDGQQGSFTLSSGGIPLREVIDNGVLYIKLPAKDIASLNVKTPWISLNLNKLLKAKIGASYQSLVSASQHNSPTDTLAILAKASSGVKKVGSAKIQGTETTEYEADIQLGKAAAAENVPSSLIQTLQSKYHLSNIPVTVWIDGSNRVRQMSEKINIPAQSGQPAASASIVVGISHFNVPINVQTPSAGQVTDVTSKVLAASASTT